MSEEKILIGNTIYEKHRKYVDTDDLEKIIIIKNRSAHRWNQMLVIITLSVLSYLLCYTTYRNVDFILSIISTAGVVILGIIGLDGLFHNEDIYYKYEE